ncbi:MAG: EamA family transporter RarD [Paracoccaceae bacterium]
MTASPAPAPLNEDTPAGFAYGVSAYMLWGFLPIYMKWLSHVPPLEVVAHRVLWSLPVALIVVFASGRTADLRAALRTPAMLRMAVVTAGLVSLNWGVYVWAIVTDRALDAALGYYINPLFSIFLGAVLLKERLAPRQWAAIALAALAVAILTAETGRLPVAALALMLTWGFYAFFRKTLPIGPNQGFALEVMLLTPPALAVMAWYVSHGTAHFAATAADTWLLIGTGAVTAIPLIVYGNAAKRLRLTTIGILQYIAPTLIFLVAVLVFGEEMGRGRMIAFPLIWAALILYTSEVLRARRARAR